MTFAPKARTLQLVVTFAFVVLCACWSTTWYAIRLCLQGYPPFLGAGLRFLLAAVILTGITLLLGRDKTQLSRKVHGAFLLAGLANGLGYACVYLAERTISGGTAAVISASSPFFTALIARLYGLETFVFSRLLGVLLGFVGVALMMSDGLDQGSSHLSAMLLVTLAAALLWPLYGALLKRHAECVSPMVSCTYMMSYSAISLLALSFVRGETLPNLRDIPAAAHLGLLYLAVVGSVIAWTVFLWLLQRLDLTVIASMGLIQPVLALAVDFVVNEGHLRFLGLVGAALVLVGVTLAALRLSTKRTSSGTRQKEEPSAVGHSIGRGAQYR